MSLLRFVIAFSMVVCHTMAWTDRVLYKTKAHVPASLFVDMSNVKAYIDKMFASEVQSVINKKLPSSIQHHTSTLATNIKGLKSKATKIKKDLQEKIDNLTTELNTIIEVQKRNRTRCQSGTYGQHSGNLRFPIETNIKFDPPFPTKPAFVYGFYLLDSSSNGYVRASAHASKLTEKGVNLRLSTWASTHLVGLRVSWMACS